MRSLKPLEQPLLTDIELGGDSPEPEPMRQPPKAAQPSVTIRVLSAGVANVLIAVNLGANSYMLKHNGHPGAGSLTTTAQALALGICGGALFATGHALGGPVGRGDFKTASEIKQAAFAMTGGFAALATAAYAGTYWLFPQVAAESTADAASTYFLTALAGNWPALALVTCGLVAFQGGDWEPMLLSTIGFRVPSTAAAIGAGLKWGVAGIGWANSIAPWPSYVAMQCFIRKYHQLSQAPVSMEAIQKHLGPLTKLGLKFSVQRLTEWGNLFALTSILGKISDENLTILNPSIQFMTLFNLFSQGIGMGGMMLVSAEKGKMAKALQALENQLKGTDLEAHENTPLATGTPEEQLTAIKVSQTKIKSVIRKSLLGGLISNGILAATLYAAREPIADLFLDADTSAEMRHTTETALWITGLSLVADAQRIITGTLLNSHGKILFQNYVAIIAMTLIGVPAGYGLGLAFDDAVIAMLAVRTGMILISALINSFELYRSTGHDQSKIDAVEELMSANDAGFNTAEPIRRLSESSTNGRVKVVPEEEAKAAANG